MRILLLTQWFDPEPTFKGLLFAKELQRRGHDVTVLTGFPNYPGGRIYDGYRLRPVARETMEGIRVVRVALYPSHDRSAVRRISNYASFALSASLAALFVRRPDVAYVYHPPATIGLPALVLRYLRGVPFVLDVQDLWPETLAATEMVRRRSVLAIVGCWMRHIYRAAARVAALSDGFRDTIAARGVPEGKIEVIPNWADEAQIDVRRPSDARTSRPGFDNPFSVVFAGTMGPAQGLTTVLDAAERLREHPRVQFTLVGGGIDAPRLAEEADRRHLTNVTFLPRRPVNEIGEILASADALLVHLRDDPLFEITIPSKTQAYLRAGRPILMGVGGDAANMVRSAQAGIAFAPGRADELADAVLALSEMPAGQRDRLAANGAAYYQNHLSLAIGVTRFEQLLDVAVLARPRSDAAKRVVDVAGSAILLVAGAPLLAGLAVLVRRDLRGPAVFRQVRPGRYGAPFTLYKFRTMTDATDESGVLLPDARRLTPLGRRLRQSSLDELPELWNVLRGDMSLVGPRPLLERYTEYFSDAERARVEVRPGITGWAQVNGRNTVSWDDRLRLDAWYVRNRSLLLDVRVLARTVRGALRGSGVVADPESVMANLDDERRSSRGQP